MIHLTWISNHVRGSRESYDTDHTGEALADAVAKWFASGDEIPGERLVLCVVIERDDCKMTRAEILDDIHDIVHIEEARLHSALTRAS